MKMKWAAGGVDTMRRLVAENDENYDQIWMRITARSGWDTWCRAWMMRSAWTDEDMWYKTWDEVSIGTDGK